MGEVEFFQVVILLGTAVAFVVAFQRLHLPSSLAYLLVGILLGPHTAGPVVDSQQMRALAEFGIVFLLFTIGLNFALPQIRAWSHQVLVLGTAQVVLTTGIIAALAGAVGVPLAAALVIGAVFAQSSTTIISKQLAEQGEENSRHGRLGTAMSVFQDVTAVPLVIIIPALGAATGTSALAGEVAWALAKALVAFVLVFVGGGRILRPLFLMVAARRSAEVFTLTVLFVSLLAAWTTDAFGLSMAFGAFLAGMVLGETEFRHQVESTMRPFRDVLLGLFFVVIGMLIDPMSIPSVGHFALLGAVVLLMVKATLVATIVRWSGLDGITAWRTGLVLAVGGEFGFAVLAIALGAEVIGTHLGQITLTSVLFSMILAPFLIRYNHALASRLAAGAYAGAHEPVPGLEAAARERFADHVIICGYGRIGQSVGHFLEEERIPFVALDLDPAVVRAAHVAGEAVFFGDSTERDILHAAGIHAARLVVVSYDDVSAACKVLSNVRAVLPELPVMVRTRDEAHVDELRAAGAVEIVPETIEAGLMIASQALLLLGVAPSRVGQRIQQQRTSRYRLMREVFRGDPLTERARDEDADRLLPVVVPAEGKAVGRVLGEIDIGDVMVTALVRDGRRQLGPALSARIQAGDVLVLFGAPRDLDLAEATLLG